MPRPTSWFETPSTSRRALLLGLAVSIPAFAILLRRPAALVDPAACPGILDPLLAMVLRAAPGVSVGSVLAWSRHATTLVALWLLAGAMRAASGSAWFAAGALFGFVLSGMLDPVLAPPTAMCVIALASATVLAARPTSAAPPRIHLAALLAVAAIPLFSPPLLLAAVMGVFTLWGLARASLAMALGAAIATVVVTLGVSAATSVADPTAGWGAALACTIPGSVVDAGAAWWAVGDAIARVGPLPFGLAVLGAFTIMLGVEAPRTRATLGAAGGLLIVLAWTHRDDAVRLTLWAAVWFLAAVGLGDVMAACRSRRAYAAGALLLVFLLPALQVQHLRLTPPLPRPLPVGHDRLSADDFWRLSRPLASTAIVTEDAAVDLLMRATANRQRRARRTLRSIARTPGEVRRAMVEGPVYLFPRAQAELQNRGVRLEPAPLGAHGIAVAASVHDCVGVSRGWSEIPVPPLASGFALVATDPRGEGPLDVFVATGQAPSVRPAGWPERAMRGFTARVYERSRTPDLSERLADLRLAPHHPLLAAPFVTRLTLWRTPGAPDVLPVALGAEPLAIVAAPRPEESERHHLQVCPSFAYPAASIEVR